MRRARALADYRPPSNRPVEHQEIAHRLEGAIGAEWDARAAVDRTRHELARAEHALSTAIARWADARVEARTIGLDGEAASGVMRIRAWLRAGEINHGTEEPDAGGVKGT